MTTVGGYDEQVSKSEDRYETESTTADAWTYTLQARETRLNQTERIIDVPVTPSPIVLVATSIPKMEDVVLPAPESSSVPMRDRDAGDFDELLNSVFGANSAKAFAVADCEMGYKLSAGSNPFELNRTAVGLLGEVSIWQIHPIHWTIYGGPYDKDLLQSSVEYAAQAAWELSDYGQSWHIPWFKCGR